MLSEELTQPDVGAKRDVDELVNKRASKPNVDSAPVNRHSLADDFAADGYSFLNNDDDDNDPYDNDGNDDDHDANDENDDELPSELPVINKTANTLRASLGASTHSGKPPSMHSQRVDVNANESITAELAIRLRLRIKWQTTHISAPPISASRCRLHEQRRE